MILKLNFHIWRQVVCFDVMRSSKIILNSQKNQILILYFNANGDDNLEKVLNKELLYTSICIVLTLSTFKYLIYFLL